MVDLIIDCLMYGGKHMDIKIEKGTLLHAKLENVTIIHGTIENVYDGSFMIDDDISGDMFIVENKEIKEVYHNF